MSGNPEISNVFCDCGISAFDGKYQIRLLVLHVVSRFELERLCGIGREYRPQIVLLVFGENLDGLLVD